MPTRRAAILAAGLVGASLGCPLAPTGLVAQGDSTAFDRRVAILMAGHAAFVDGRYDEAIRQYELARRRGSSWTGIPDMIRAVEHRRDLGAIAPADTHRIGVIYVVELRTLRPDGTWESRPDVTTEQKATWRIYRGVVRRILESFTDGRWTLAFSEVDALSSRTAGSPLNPHNPDHLDLERYFFTYADSIDTYVTLSNTVSPARGLARRYPYVSGVLYGPPRGLVLLNAGTHGFGVLLHEFFHTIEWVVGISPAHGFDSRFRSSFPGWTGTTELDYYRWHFATTLRGADFGRFDLPSRFRGLPGDAAPALERITAAYRAMPLASRQVARRLAEEAGRIPRADTAGVMARYRRALALSPYDLEALAGAFRLQRAANPASESLAVWAGRLADARAVGEFRDMDAVPEDARALGRPLGRWWPDQLATDGVALEWDVTREIHSAGTLDVSFWYTEGWNALAIDSVTLLENGTEVARDVHAGRSGRDRRDISYTLALHTRRPGARYSVRARVAGVNGTESNGLVLLRLR